MLVCGHSGLSYDGFMADVLALHVVMHRSAPTPVLQMLIHSVASMRETQAA
jgi:hypothetical protein